MKAMVLSDRQDVGLDDVPLESSLNPNKYWDVDEYETFRSRNNRVKVTKSELDRYLDYELLDIILNFDILVFLKDAHMPISYFGRVGQGYLSYSCIYCCL